MKIPSIESVRGVAWIGSLILVGAFAWLAHQSTERSDALWDAQHRLCVEAARSLPAMVARCPELAAREAQRQLSWSLWFGGYLAAQILFLGALQQVGRATLRLSSRHEADLLVEQRQRESTRRRLENLTSHVPGVVFELTQRAGEDLTVAYVSAGALEVLGDPPWVLLGGLNPLAERVHADDQVLLAEQLRASMRQLTVWASEFRYQHPTRGEVWLRAGATPQQHADGTHAWYGVAVDITHRKGIEAHVARVYDEVQVARAQTDALIDSTTGTAIMVTDLEGRITRFSRSAEALLGWVADEVVDFARPANFLDGVEQHAVDAQSGRGLLEGQSTRFEGRLRHRNGRLIPARVTVTRIASPGSVDTDMAYLWVMTDVSELARALQDARDAAARLQTVTDNAPVLISQFDLQGRHVFCNREYARWWGIAPGTALGQTQAQLLGDDVAALLAPSQAAAMRGELLEQVIAPKPGRWLEIRYVPHCVETQVVGVFWVAVEVTERLQREATQKAFVSTVSHELRTPLTAINGVLGLVSGGALGPMPEEMAEMLALAEQNGQRLALLVNDLLDLDQLSQGKLAVRPERLSLSVALHEAVTLNRAYADTCSVALTLEPPAHALFRADAQRFQQIMANLISNAAKFSPAGAEVLISAERLDQAVRISVRDQGAGIPLLFQPRVFDRFAQADSSDRRQSHGSGLGLAIARELVELMGGEIGFDSVDGVGTRFWFTLPAEV